MKTYRIHRTDLIVSRIAYGCMNIGGSWDGNPVSTGQKAKASAAVMAAYEHGITLFDHADIYSRGKSEQVFGEILQEHPGIRTNIVLQTKCGIRRKDDPHAGVPGRYDFGYEHIIAAVEGSLRRLRTEYVDILLLHRPDPLVEPEEVAKAFDELHENGKVLYFGVSNHTGGQITLLQNYVRQPIVINQVELNLLHNHLINEGIVANMEGGHFTAAPGTLDYCRLNDIMIQAWAPVAGGKLFNSVQQTEEHLKNLAEMISSMAKERQTSREAIMLAWLLRHPAGIQPIIGTTNPERIIASSEADNVTLTREEWYELFVAARGKAVP
jgi:predicted oxidoreductase